MNIVCNIVYHVVDAYFRKKSELLWIWRSSDQAKLQLGERLEYESVFNCQLSYSNTQSMF